MNFIPENTDKIQAIKDYLVANRSDQEADSWIFGHHPNIVEILKTFTKKESIKLKREIVNWEETEQYNIADPISDVKNKFIDGNHIYGEIFLSIQDFEKLEYLIQNLVIIVRDSPVKRPIEFYEATLNKTKKLNKKLNNGYVNLITSIEDKIEKEKADNAMLGII